MRCRFAHEEGKDGWFDSPVGLAHERAEIGALSAGGIRPGIAIKRCCSTGVTFGPLDRQAAAAGKISVEVPYAGRQRALGR